ncbi:MAG: hypothetical protein ABL901_10555 [Hyphomicrobiaceae bacterium]
MSERYYPGGRHDPFGWFKTSCLVLVVFSLMLVTGVMAARADDCPSSCRQRHNQCRIQTKGAPSCDAQLETCIRSCMASQSKAPPPKK